MSSSSQQDLWHDQSLHAYCSLACPSHIGRFYIVQEPTRQGAKCRLLVLAKHRLPVHPAAP